MKKKLIVTSNDSISIPHFHLFIFIYFDQSDIFQLETSRTQIKGLDCVQFQYNDHTVIMDGGETIIYFS